MAKKLMINCGTCDARFTREETLAAYESVVINAGDVLVTPESRELLNRCGVTMNCGNVRELDKDVKIQSINGSTHISGSTPVAERVYLKVNGSVTVEADAAEVLKSYAGFDINGSVICPQSLAGYLGNVNGSTTIYPDGAVVLKRNAVIDRTFALRAKERLYWSAKRVIMVDPGLDAALLAARGASFSAEEAIVAESKVEAVLDRVDEKAEIIIVPDGTAVITDDAELNDVLVNRYGRKLYILGDLEIDDEGGEQLRALEYLNVRGDVKVTEAWKDALLKKAQIGGTVKVVKCRKGRRISDKLSVRIDRWLLEQEQGIRVSDCMNVTLDEDIPPELILEKLEFRDCMEIRCSPAQETAVAAVSEDVMAVGGLDKLIGKVSELAGGTGVGGKVKSAVDNAFDMAKGLLDTKMISAGDYVL